MWQGAHIFPKESFSYGKIKSKKMTIGNVFKIFRLICQIGYMVRKIYKG